MKKTTLTLIGMVTCAAAGYAAAKAPPAREVQLLAESMKFDAVFGPTGPKQALLREDKLGAAVMLRLPAGYDSDWHTHDTDYDAVVLSGTVSEPVQGGGEAPWLTAGSYYFQPARQNHATRCVSTDADCVIFIVRQGAFSIHATTPDGRPRPAPHPTAK